MKKTKKSLIFLKTVNSLCSNSTVLKRKNINFSLRLFPEAEISPKYYRINQLLSSLNFTSVWLRRSARVSNL